MIVVSVNLDPRQAPPRLPGRPVALVRCCRFVLLATALTGALGTAVSPRVGGPPFIAVRAGKGRSVPWSRIAEGTGFGRAAIAMSVWPGARPA